MAGLRLIGGQVMSMRSKHHHEQRDRLVHTFDSSATRFNSASLYRFLRRNRLSLEDAILLAVKDCYRSGIRATHNTVQPRLPETLTYSPDWIKVKMSMMAQTGKLRKVGKRKGYMPPEFCPCCGSRINHHCLAN